jgi:periplasmic divalent cation tolerance protein
MAFSAYLSSVDSYQFHTDERLFHDGALPNAMADSGARSPWETRVTDAIALRDIQLVTTTVATEPEARRLAQSVLQARLAACVQVEPITAYFRWQGALQEDRELRVVCKTMPRAVPALLGLLRAQHPYTLPQMVVQTAQASVEYGAWVDAQMADAGAVLV